MDRIPKFWTLLGSLVAFLVHFGSSVCRSEILQKSNSSKFNATKSYLDFNKLSILNELKHNYISYQDQEPVNLDYQPYQNVNLFEQFFKEHPPGRFSTYKKHKRFTDRTNCLQQTLLDMSFKRIGSTSSEIRCAKLLH